MFMKRPESFEESPQNKRKRPILSENSPENPVSKQKIPKHSVPEIFDKSQGLVWILAR